MIVTAEISHVETIDMNSLAAQQHLRLIRQHESETRRAYDLLEQPPDQPEDCHQNTKWHQWLYLDLPSTPGGTIITSARDPTLEYSAAPVVHPCGLIWASMSQIDWMG